MLIKGKLYLFSEQGMEGGYLSIIDNNFIDYYKPNHGIQENIKVYDAKFPSKVGVTSKAEMYSNDSWIPLRDPILDDVDYKISSLYVGEEKGDFEADKRLMLKYNFKLIYTKEKADRLYGKGNWTFNKSKSRIILNNGKIMMLGGTPESIPQRPYLIPNANLVRVTVHWNDGTIEEKRLSNTLFLERWNFDGLHIIEKNDYVKVLEANTNNTISEGKIKQIPLKIFSHTIENHFTNKSQHWKNYFINEYRAEIYRSEGKSKKRQSFWLKFLKYLRYFFIFHTSNLTLFFDFCKLNLKSNFV